MIKNNNYISTIFILFFFTSCNNIISDKEISRYIQSSNEFVTNEIKLSEDGTFLELRDNLSFKKVKNLKEIWYSNEQYSNEEYSNTISDNFIRNSQFLTGFKKTFMYDPKLIFLKKSKNGVFYETRGVFTNKQILPSEVPRYTRKFYVYKTYLPNNFNITIYLFYIP